MTTIADALKVASQHWEGRPGGKVMSSMAKRCGEALGVHLKVADLGPPDAVRLLAALRTSGLSAKSIGSYYGAFKRAIVLSGGNSSLPLWPKAPTSPRKTRDPLNSDDFASVVGWLRQEGMASTADLAVVLAATGLRVRVEALTPSHIRVSRGDTFDTLHVIGKGGHERLIPVVSDEARAILMDPERLGNTHAVTYGTHLHRWNRALEAVGVTSRLATFHSVRHGYASDALRKSGGNLVLVQELLGHADPATTARYLSVDLSAKAAALASSS